MQIGEEDQTGAQVAILGGERLLHLEDHLGARPHLGGARRASRPPRRSAASAMLLPRPAPRSTITSWPCATSAATPLGVSATRFSSGLISCGTPMRMRRILCAGRAFTKPPAHIYTSRRAGAGRRAAISRRVAPGRSIAARDADALAPCRRRRRAADTETMSTILDGKAVAQRCARRRRRASSALARARRRARAGDGAGRRRSRLARLRPQQGARLRRGRHALDRPASCPPTRTTRELLALVAGAQRARPTSTASSCSCRCRRHRRRRGDPGDRARQGRRRPDPISQGRLLAGRAGPAAVHAARHHAPARRDRRELRGRARRRRRPQHPGRQAGRAAAARATRDGDASATRARAISRRGAAAPTSWSPRSASRSMIRGDWIKPGAVVIDVGINRLRDGKLVGDVDFATRARARRRGSRRCRAASGR